MSKNSKNNDLTENNQEEERKNHLVAQEIHNDHQGCSNNRNDRNEQEEKEEKDEHLSLDDLDTEGIRLLTGSETRSYSVSQPEAVKNTPGLGYVRQHRITNRDLTFAANLAIAAGNVEMLMMILKFGYSKHNLVKLGKGSKVGNDRDSEAERSIERTLNYDVVDEVKEMRKLKQYRDALCSIYRNYEDTSVTKIKLMVHLMGAIAMRTPWGKDLISRLERLCRKEWDSNAKLLRAIRRAQTTGGCMVSNFVGSRKKDPDEDRRDMKSVRKTLKKLRKNKPIGCMSNKDRKSNKSTPSEKGRKRNWVLGLEDVSYDSCSRVAFELNNEAVEYTFVEGIQLSIAETSYKATSDIHAMIDSIDLNPSLEIDEKILHAWESVLKAEEFNDEINKIRMSCIELHTLPILSNIEAKEVVESRREMQRQMEELVRREGKDCQEMKNYLAMGGTVAITASLAVASVGAAMMPAMVATKAGLMALSIACIIC